MEMGNRTYDEETTVKIKENTKDSYVQRAQMLLQQNKYRNITTHESPIRLKLRHKKLSAQIKHGRVLGPNNIP